MWYAGCVAVLLVFVMGSVSAAPVNIIFDTDMDTDVDDVGALAIIHALADQGEANLLAVIHSAPKPEGPVCAQAINAWYGRENVPVGWTDWPDLETSPIYEHYRNARAYIQKVDSDYVPVIAAAYSKSKNGDTPPVEDGVALYRKTLASAADGSVTICAVGQLAALAGLLESGPDQYSDLDGHALVAQKTKALVSMALSQIPEGPDGFNWRCDLPSAAKVINHWPTALAVMPIGAEILTGGPLVMQGDPANPCRNAYDIYVKDAHKSRSSWDLCAVLYAISGAGPWFREQSGYRIQLDEKTAVSHWQKDPGSPQVLLTQRASDTEIRDHLDNLLLQIPAAAIAKMDTARAARTAWFTEARFGMFVHWGSYAVPARNNKGALASFVMHDEGIPVEAYEPYADAFKPEKFDADQWMAIAKAAGMRYLIFTSKHHEGFCMFDSALTDYDAMDRGPEKDFVRELITAARAADMKIGFYYSMLDWHHPEYKTDLPKYIDEYLFGQIRELCNNYGPIDCIWFDGEWDHPLDTWRAPELINLIRELQPNALINDRIGKGERGNTLLVDFYTREQPHEIDTSMAFERRRTIPWEACMTMGDSWGYRSNDTNLKSSAELIRYLVTIASRGGNLLLNVGPMADGTIPSPFVERLEDVGAWMAKNGESIYGTQGSPFESFTVGKCTTKGNMLYIHLESAPDGPIHLPELRNSIQRAWFLANDEELIVDNRSKTILVPAPLPDPAVTTIAVELEGEIRVDE